MVVSDIICRIIHLCEKMNMLFPESYELGFSKGLIDPGESVYEAANRELKEEVGFGANDLTFLKKLSMAPSYFSSKMNIVVAQDLYPESLEGDVRKKIFL